MIRRSTWIILILFIAVLGLAMYLQRSGQGADAATTSTPGLQKLFDFTESDISKLRVEQSQSNAVALERDANNLWTLVEPAGQAIDVGTAEAAVSQLVALNVMNTLQQEPDPAVVGLDPAAYKITIDLAAERQVVLNVGNVTPIDNGYYIRVDDGPIQVVSKFALEEVLDMVDNPPVLATAAPTLGAETTPAGTGTPGTPEATGAVTPEPPAAGTSTP